MHSSSDMENRVLLLIDAHAHALADTLESAQGQECSVWAKLPSLLCLRLFLASLATAALDATCVTVPCQSLSLPQTHRAETACWTPPLRYLLDPKPGVPMAEVVILFIFSRLFFLSPLHHSAASRHIHMFRPGDPFSPAASSGLLSP